MKNPKAKGNRAELELRRMLEEWGWKVERVKSGGKFAKSIDFWGLFDLIALRGKYKKFIQVKSNRKPVLKSFKEFADEHANKFDSVEVWVRKDNLPQDKRWRVYSYIPYEGWESK